ncbi:MAG: WD40 repeat domain-containing protein [Treponema sp.]|nr:WD40 repeat domain-containing protein [Treponema sp.]
MKTKKHTHIYIFLVFLFIIIYIILAVKPLGKEYHFTPEWRKNITTPANSAISSGTRQIEFKLGQSIGYFTEDGQITSLISFPSKASISSDYYAIYTTEDSNIAFYNKNNNEQGNFEVSGFPYFEQDRIFVFLPGGSSFSKCDSQGKVIWVNENTVPLTAFSSKEKYTAAGYADGAIRIFDNNTGFETLSFVPGGSDYNVILGLDVSSDGMYTASVSGHNKQRFVLTKNDNKQPKIIYHNYLDSDMNKQTVVKFCNDDKRILYYYDGNLGIYNIEKQKETNIKIDKTVIAIEETDSLIFVLGKKNKEYTVYIIEKTDTLEGSFSFEADTAFIKTCNNNLYVGQDTSISKVRISKE